MAPTPSNALTSAIVGQGLSSVLQIPDVLRCPGNNLVRWMAGTPNGPVTCNRRQPPCARQVQVQCTGTARANNTRYLHNPSAVKLLQDVASAPAKSKPARMHKHFCAFASQYNQQVLLRKRCGISALQGTVLRMSHAACALLYHAAASCQCTKP